MVRVKAPGWRWHGTRGREVGGRRGACREHTVITQGLEHEDRDARNPVWRQSSIPPSDYKGDT